MEFAAASTSFKEFQTAVEVLSSTEPRLGCNFFLGNKRLHRYAGVGSELAKWYWINLWDKISA